MSAAASRRLTNLLRSSSFARTALTARGRDGLPGHSRRKQRHMRWDSSFAPRHGKGVEPVIFEENKTQEENNTQQQQQRQEEETPEQQQQQTATTTRKAESSGTKSIVKCENQDSDGDATNKTHELDPSGNNNARHESNKMYSLSAYTSDEHERTRHIKDEAKANGPLEAVMRLKSPSSSSSSRTTKGPHPQMSPSPYVHHFDSYTLVKHLLNGGYTQPQAIEAMKGIRALLAQNLDVAQESLVSKSDVENEAYLFSAACSELGQEIKNNRRLQDEQERQQRTHLQHEVDILTQSLNQEVLTLNDSVRGMFNDRKMTVREEQKSADSAIQQINYKISTSLVSNSMSEIEGVRWILIRRSALGIFFMAMLTLATVRYATYLNSERKKEVEAEREERERRRRETGKADNSAAADAAVILAAN